MQSVDQLQSLLIISVDRRIVFLRYFEFAG